MIAFHLAAALAAFALGSVNLALAKGTPRHRVVGWLWIAAMACVTLPSFAIREVGEGSFSWIHGLSVWTLISMALAIAAIRRGNARAHAGFMIGTMAGVAIAGLFALAPGREIARLLGYG